ncbi:hypothetical protein T03_16983 [Trichinella britovi]|uniref:Uncharacterized protein n=1 Tax=Trichinella britovi TaxID=45882 RepID=A0A0V1CS12_TRIBR|nr:hypothetical protein T03_16983 [Trichinella britovi]
MISANKLYLIIFDLIEKGFNSIYKTMKRQPEAKFSAVLAFCSLTVPEFNVEIVLARVKFEHVFDQNEISLNQKELKLKQVQANIGKSKTPYQDLNFIKARKSAATGQSRAAAKMTRRSTKMLKPLNIDQNARLIVIVRTLLVAEKENWHLSLQLQIYKSYQKIYNQLMKYLTLKFLLEMQ